MDLLRPARERLQFFVDHGQLSELPTGWQLGVGTLAMLPFVLSETPAAHARGQRSLLSQIPLRAPLQALYNPAQALVGNGLLAHRETIIKHVLSVYHDGVTVTYDIQLVQAHPGGLDALEAEARAVIDGTHRWARLLRALVGGADYHPRVLELLARARRFDYAVDPDADPRFSTVIGFARYCLSLPKWPPLGFYGLDREALRRALNRAVEAALSPDREQDDAEGAPDAAAARVVEAARVAASQLPPRAEPAPMAP